MLFGERLVQAREILGLTQTELATTIGVTQSAVAHIEAGRTLPSPILMDRLTSETPFPAKFFASEPSPHFPMGSLQFRARKKMTMAQRRQSYQYARLSYEIYEKLAIGISLPPIRIRPHTGEPEKIAQQVRATLGVADQSPVANVAMLLERVGIVVLALPIALPERDGFSGWADGGRIPVIVMPRHDQGDRGRFTMAHELGELLFASLPPGDDREHAADTFASSFLLPPEAMRREFFGTSVTLTSLAAAKKRWKVSMAAIAYAAKRLEIISERHHRTLMQHISAKGWRIVEPITLAVAPEKPRALRKIVELKYGETPNFTRMGHDLHLNPFMLREIISSYASKSDLLGYKPSSRSDVSRIR